MDSILSSVKKMLGIDAEYKYFDMDLAMHIGSVLAILNQLGVGPSVGLSIVDESTTWSAITTDSTLVNLVKPYVYLKVKLLFDPPTSGAVMEANNKLLSEYEWRILTETQKPQSNTGGGIQNG